MSLFYCQVHEVPLYSFLKAGFGEFSLFMAGDHGGIWQV